MHIRHLESTDREALVAFLERVPEADRTFFKEDVADPSVIDRWMHPGPVRAVAIEYAEIVGCRSVVPLHGWSSHVGELRLVVDPAHRGRGVGRALARQAMLEALELGLKKVVVEVIAVQEPAIEMFRSLGFDPEALLTDQVRDRTGELRDLMILSHSVEEQRASMITTGIADDI